MLLRVYVGDYFCGEARSMAEADGLSMGYAAWLVSSGPCEAVLSFRYEQGRRVVVRGELEVRDTGLRTAPNLSRAPVGEG